LATGTETSTCNRSTQQLDGSRRALPQGIRRTIPILIISIIAFVDRGNVGFAKLQFMSDLGFTEAVFGLGGGLFYLGYSVFEIPSNLLLAKTGARLTLLRIMVLWGACSAALALMSTPAHFYTLRSLLGAAEAGFFPGVLFYLTTWIPASRRARFTAMFMSAIGISGVISGPIPGSIMQEPRRRSGYARLAVDVHRRGIPAVLMGVRISYLLRGQSVDRQMAVAAREQRDRRGGLCERAADKKDRAACLVLGALTDLRVYSLVAMSDLPDAAQALAFRCCVAADDRQGESGVANVWYIGLSRPFRGQSLSSDSSWARRSDRIGERRWHAAIPAFDRLGVDCPSLGEFECGAIPGDDYGDDDWLSLRDRPVLDDAGALSLGVGCSWRHRSDHDCGKYCSLLRPDDCRLGVLHDRIALSRSVFLRRLLESRGRDHACRNTDAFTGGPCKCPILAKA
jgi:hypothetical protein